MVDLMGKKYYFFALSLVILIVCIVGFLANGVVLDIQFQGGTIMQIEMPDDNFDTELAADIVKNAIGKTATVNKSSTFNAENEDERIYLMVLNIASEETLTEDERTAVIDALREEFSIAEDASINVNSVEPFIGEEFRMNAVKAIVISSILIVLYVWLRFRSMHGLSAGVFAVIALVHDIMVMFTAYVIFRIPLNDSFVAAMLTIIGYSINDTIVIYDRIRENTKLMRKASYRELVNKSVLQCLTRSINTSLTTLIAVLTLLVFAVIYNIQSIREFTMPLVVGLISGVYSTLFIASPLYMMWQERKLNRKAAAQKPAKT
ncbi:MAG TPA: protein translocase subunit SecF [Clostridiales bacterium]|nr:protein translocase subunit SecF [Clostridiales bacterium]HPP35715.1 protein translocase subunit SecF [Clostridiales bacterium]